MAVGLVVSRVARLLELLRTRLYACVSDHKDGAVQVCRNRDLTDWVSLGNFLVSLPVALGLSFSGELWLRVAKPNSSYLIEMTRVGDLRQLLAGLSKWLKRPLLYH